MNIGGYSVRALQGGPFRLDGGGLFGVVPRALWQRQMDSDDDNRVRLGCTCLLLEGHGRRVLIETGCGDKFDAKGRAIYAIEQPGGVLAALAEIGVEPASIDAVILSHLHFDHAGGTTTLGPAGEPTLSFPNAELFVQQREWDDARTNYSHMKSTYLPENIAPLADSGRVRLAAGAAELLDNIRVESAPGHTPGSQAIFVVGEPTLCFIGDIVPTRHHLRPYWTTSYDMAPADVIQTRARLLDRAAEEGWIVVLPHDAEVVGGRIDRDDKGRWSLQPIAWGSLQA